MFATYFIIAAHVLTVILSAMTLVYAIRLTQNIKGLSQVGWWLLYPAALLYAILDRLLMIAAMLAGYNNLIDVLYAAMIGCWIGLLLFTRAMYISARIVGKKE